MPTCLYDHLQILILATFIHIENITILIFPYKIGSFHCLKTRIINPLTDPTRLVAGHGVWDKMNSLTSHEATALTATQTSQPSLLALSSSSPLQKQPRIPR